MMISRRFLTAVVTKTVTTSETRTDIITGAPS
jgi:hypothetical protein